MKPRSAVDDELAAMGLPREAAIPALLNLLIQPYRMSVVRDLEEAHRRADACPPPRLH